MILFPTIKYSKFEYMRKKYADLFTAFEKALLKLGFTASKAHDCAEIFTNNSRDGVYSHGLNRFPVFVEYVKKGFINKDAEPVLSKSLGMLEQWDGGFGPGMLNAQFCMQRAIDLAKANGMSCVALKNTNHWMRGGTYGWQAAEAGCIGINFTNTIAVMPPWGATEVAMGNNPLVISVPREAGHLVLDMAMSQFSYGKLQEYELSGQELPFYGGYDGEGLLSKDPKAIRKTRRTLPIGMWKGSALAMMLDILASVLSDGESTGQITRGGAERGVSQVFICMDALNHPNSGVIIDQIIAYTKSVKATDGLNIRYPGEHTLSIREENLRLGIPVDEKMWNMLVLS